jgi:hypothetical protein
VNNPANTSVTLKFPLAIIITLLCLYSMQPFPTARC